ncbi:unnamed protein product [Rhizophagus irregularis]|nr:unnamed protein product [Rhizophagus irregularis]
MIKFFLLPNSAFYMKDVINVDKQNNGAAFRFFSSAVLTQYQKDGNIESERLVLFVYLFIFGELFNVYLNHIISHKSSYIFLILMIIFYLNEIELLGCWPSDDDIGDAIRIAYKFNDDDKSNSEESENENENNTIDDSCLNFIKATEILKFNIIRE